jgi:hypothetical protein
LFDAERKKDFFEQAFQHSVALALKRNKAKRT